MIWWWWFSFCPDLLTPEGVLWYQELSSRFCVSHLVCGIGPLSSARVQ